MGPVNAEVAIDVPREVAFDFVADLANRPAFTDHFVSDFHLLRVESSGVGAGARFRFFAPPQAIWMDTTIVELERTQRISERGTGGRWASYSVTNGGSRNPMPSSRQPSSSIPIMPTPGRSGR